MTSPRAAATAAAIEDAALDLALFERGYDQVTVDLICDRVGISQRTFFNHFPTKDDALLGRDMPRVDERAARRFILATGPLLLDALSLVELPEGERLHRRIAERMRVISSSPSLLSSQMERIAAIEDELSEIIALRLRHQDPELPETGVQDRASMATSMLAGVLRWIGTRAEHAGEGAEALERIAAEAREVVGGVLGSRES